MCSSGVATPRLKRPSISPRSLRGSLRSTLSSPLRSHLLDSGLDFCTSCTGDGSSGRFERKGELTHALRGTRVALTTGMGRRDRFSLHTLIGSMRRAGVLLAGALALFVAPFPLTLAGTALAQGSIEPGGTASDSAPAARAGRATTAKATRKKPARKSRTAHGGDVAPAPAQPAAPEWTPT